MRGRLEGRRAFPGFERPGGIGVLGAAWVQAGPLSKQGGFGAPSVCPDSAEGAAASARRPGLNGDTLNVTAFGNDVRAIHVGRRRYPHILKCGCCAAAVRVRDSEERATGQLRG